MNSPAPLQKLPRKREALRIGDPRSPACSAIDHRTTPAGAARGCRRPHGKYHRCGRAEKRCPCSTDTEVDSDVLGAAVRRGGASSCAISPLWPPVHSGKLSERSHRMWRKVDHLARRSRHPRKTGSRGTRQSRANALTGNRTRWRDAARCSPVRLGRVRRSRRDSVPIGSACPAPVPGERRFLGILSMPSPCLPARRRPGPRTAGRSSFLARPKGGLAIFSHSRKRHCRDAGSTCTLVSGGRPWNARTPTLDSKNPADQCCPVPTNTATNGEGA